MIGKKFNIDIQNKDKYPKVIEKDNETEEGFISVIVEMEEGENYKAIIERISTSGKYLIQIVEKLNWQKKYKMLSYFIWMISEKTLRI